LGLAKVVFRPDSGDPVKIITGYKIYNPDLHDCTYWEMQEEGYEVFFNPDSGMYYPIKYFYDRDGYVDSYEYGSEISEWEAKGALDCLAEIFGTTTNDKGFKTLNQRVGLIYGDSITPVRAEQILQRMMDKGYASDNIVFGVGSYTFQYVTRDTFGFAMKATYVVINGEGSAIFKDPITDSGLKKSAKGLLKVTKENGKYVLWNNVTVEEEQEGELVPVYKHGKILINDSIATIRNRLRAYRV
jgi:nicotinamide phosphoribosyltransferase